jgi:hypothetical protein
VDDATPASGGLDLSWICKFGRKPKVTATLHKLAMQAPGEKRRLLDSVLSIPTGAALDEWFLIV